MSCLTKTLAPHGRGGKKALLFRIFRATSVLGEETEPEMDAATGREPLKSVDIYGSEVEKCGK